MGSGGATLTDESGDWLITIRTTMVHCINLFGGSNGPPAYGKFKSGYCNLLENLSGKCRKADCPLTKNDGRLY